jgi:hypothetical protein
MKDFIDWYITFWNSYEDLRNSILVALIPAITIWYLSKNKE